MTRFVTTVATLALVSTGALAASHEASEDAATMEATESADTAMTETDTMMPAGNLIRSRDITGGAIYTTNEADDEGWDATYDAVSADWNQVGEIEDIVLSEDGKLVGIVGEVGGFLDLGDKHVMIEVDDVQLVPVDDRSYAYVTRLSEEELEAMEGVDEGFWN